MAKITLRNYDELIVTNEEAERIQKEKLAQTEFNLPITIHHDDGLWVGTIRDVATVSTEEKRIQKYFLKDSDIHRIHYHHGYGKYEGKYEPGYGYLDVASQYQIGLGVAKLQEDSYGRKHFITVKSELAIKYEEYWKDYLSKLDQFNELQEPWKNQMQSNQQ